MYPYSCFERLSVLGDLPPFSYVRRDHMELVGIGAGGGAVLVVGVGSCVWITGLEWG